MKFLLWSMCILASSSALGTVLDNESISIAEVVKRANHVAYYQGKDGKAKVRMQIVDSENRRRKREFSILRKDIDAIEDNEQKLYVYFHGPADVKKTVFLVWKNMDKADDRWLYLPGLDLVKRIAASDERTSFVGSHFYYEDVSGRNPSKDIHNFVESNDEFYILKSVPKKADSVEFSFYKSWIDKKTFIPMRIEYYNIENEIYRYYEVMGTAKIGSFPTVTQAKMVDSRYDGYTKMTYGNVRYDLEIPEDIFSERYLRKAPRKYLK